MNRFMLQYRFLLCVFCIFFWTILIHCLRSNHPHFVWQETGNGERELKPRLHLTNTTHFLSFLQSDTTVKTKNEGNLDHGLCTCRIDTQNNNFLNQLTDTVKSTQSETSFRQLRPHKYFSNKNSFINDHQNNKREQLLPQKLNKRSVIMQQTLLNLPQHIPENLVFRPQFTSYVHTRRNYRNPYGFIQKNSKNLWTR